MVAQSDDIDVPEAIIDEILTDIERRGFESGAISPSDSALALAGIYEQEYVAQITFPDADEGLAVYSASQQDGEWTVELLVTSRM